MESEIKVEKKKRQFNPDRIVLEAKSVDFIKRLQSQIEEVFSGVIKLSNKEITNFLLQQRTEVLTQVELDSIRQEHFDDVRAAQWALKKLKNAKSGGESLSLKDVLKMIETPLANKNQRTRTPKVKRERLMSGPTQPAPGKLVTGDSTSPSEA